MSPRSAELSLYVHKDFRGKGIGEKLLQRMFEEARAQEGRFHVIIGEPSTSTGPHKTTAAADIDGGDSGRDCGECPNGELLAEAGLRAVRDPPRGGVQVRAMAGRVVFPDFCISQGVEVARKV